MQAQTPQTPPSDAHEEQMVRDSVPLAESPEWLLYSGARNRQRLAGVFAAVLLILAFVVLADGLLSRMRGGGSYRLEMLPGTSEAVSGPMGSGPALASEMRAFPIPADAGTLKPEIGFGPATTGSLSVDSVRLQLFPAEKKE